MVKIRITVLEDGLIEISQTVSKENKTKQVNKNCEKITEDVT